VALSAATTCSIFMKREPLTTIDAAAGASANAASSCVTASK